MILIAARPKLHTSSQFSLGLPANVQKLTDVREQLGEERNTNRITPTPIAPITPIAPMSMAPGLLPK